MWTGVGNQEQWRQSYSEPKQLQMFLINSFVLDKVSCESMKKNMIRLRYMDYSLFLSPLLIFLDFTPLQSYVEKQGEQNI